MMQRPSRRFAERFQAATTKTIDNPDQDDSIHQEEIGVWKLMTMKTSDSSSNLATGRLKHYRKLLPIAWRLVVDIYRFAPLAIVMLVGCWMVDAVRTAVMIRLSSDLLRRVEAGLQQGKPVARVVIESVVARGVYSLVAAYVNAFSGTIRKRMEREVTNHYELQLMDATLTVDPKSPNASSKPFPGAMWTTFESLFSRVFTLFTTASEMAVIFHAVQTSKLVLALLLIRPFLDNLVNPGIWNKAAVAIANHPAYVRLKAMQLMCGVELREDVVCGGLSKWIIKEYGQALRALRGLALDNPIRSRIRTSNHPPLTVGLKTVLDDMPLAICLLTALYDKTTPFSLVNAAILQTSMSSIRHSVSMMFNARFDDHILGAMMEVEKVYQILDSREEKELGGLSYPPHDGSESNDGMGFEVREMTFSYPGSQAPAPSLQDINLTIPPGSLVVIVGENGSGKSTLIRLLAGLYNPDKGSILIDGYPVKEYKPNDLRQASIILNQDAKVYPLTFAENIGLGCVEHLEDREMVREAAEKGGATRFVERLEKGYETVLDPLVESTAINVPADPNHPLSRILRSKEYQAIGISGGEKQRLIASRAFMRLNTGKVKFIAVDEPTSALDADAEFRLFNELLGVREGKTMIFVTHRFGHLTKHADIILTLKEGRLTEVGTHLELLERGGEYSRLYNIQASAFQA